MTYSESEVFIIAFYLTKKFFKMKKLVWLFSCAMILTTLVLTTGCEEDPVDPPVENPDPPFISITNQPAAVYQDLSTQVTVGVSVLVGTNPLRSLAVKEDGVLVDDSRVERNGITESNILILGDDVNGLQWDLNLTIHDAYDTRTYTIEVTDEANLTDVASFDITIEDAGTPLDMTLTGVLFNQAGPAGKGTLDLDEGLSAGVSSDGETTPDQTEIRDMGLDCTIPAPGFNWRRQIGAFNGSEIRQVDLTQVENFTFDNVTTKEEILGAFDTGITFTDGESENCANGNTSSVQFVTGIMEAGSLYTVKSSGGTVYLLRVDEVNETEMDNDDNYVISIKY